MWILQQSKLLSLLTWTKVGHIYVQPIKQIIRKLYVCVLKFLKVSAVVKAILYIPSVREKNYILETQYLFIPLACAEYDNSLPFSGASSIPVCYVLFPATLLH